MLIHSGLGPEFWGHSIMTACYLLNRKANRHCEGVSPYQKLFNIVPEVSHLRTFGAVCYDLIPKQFRDPHRHKATADVGIMVGYSRQSAAYLLYKPKTQRVYVRHDCWFDENYRLARVQPDGLVKNAYDAPVTKHPALVDEPMLQLSIAQW